MNEKMTNEEKAEEILQTKGSMTFCAKGCGYTEKVKKLIAIGLAEGRKEEAGLIFESWCKGSDDEPCECGFLKKLEKEKLKTELMHLKGCKQCKDRPKGELATVCPTEYEQHCIGQKMTYIKELETENKDLCESLDIMNNRESELLEQIEKMKNVGNCKKSMTCAKWNEKQTMLGCMKFCKNCKEWELVE